MTKRLLILRHAESGHSFTGDDHSRSLTQHGDEQARQVGKWMLERQLFPESTVVSDAMRTRQTCIWLTHELGEKAPTPYVDSRLYLAGPRQMLSVVNETPESAQTLLVIAHMPGVQELAMELASMESDEQAVLDMAEHWAPAGLAVLEVTKPWGELDGRDAHLRCFRS